MKSFFLQGLDAALLELDDILSLSHSLLYFWTTAISFVSRSSRIRREASSRWLVIPIISLGCLGYGAMPKAGLILRPCKVVIKTQISERKKLKISVNPTDEKNVWLQSGKELKTADKRLSSSPR